jgi:hypothetical protein
MTKRVQVSSQSWTNITPLYILVDQFFQTFLAFTSFAGYCVAYGWLYQKILNSARHPMISGNELNVMDEDRQQRREKWIELLKGSFSRKAPTTSRVIKDNAKKEIGKNV